MEGTGFHILVKFFYKITQMLISSEWESVMVGISLKNNNRLMIKNFMQLESQAKVRKMFFCSKKSLTYNIITNKIML